MPELGARERASLRKTAFAYIDSKGRKRLPIHDEAHVRNAMARFSQTRFEGDAARERALRKILTAAKKYGIVPVGFFARQLRDERRQAEAIARADHDADLPAGFVTFLLTDIEDSTGLLDRLGEAYARLLSDVRSIMRAAVRRRDGREVDARADEFFAVFERPPAALEAALEIHRRLRDRRWPQRVEVRVRIGIHSGRPTLSESGYVGLAVNTAARVCSVGHGGQTLVSAAAREAIDSAVPEGTEFRSLGAYHLHGLRQAQPLFEVIAPDLPTGFPPPRNAVPRRAEPTRTPHWRPAG